MSERGTEPTPGANGTSGIFDPLASDPQHGLDTAANRPPSGESIAKLTFVLVEITGAVRGKNALRRSRRYQGIRMCPVPSR